MPCLSHHHQVLDSDAAEAFDVDARFYCFKPVCFKGSVAAGIQSGILVDVEAYAVAQTVAEIISVAGDLSCPRLIGQKRPGTPGS